MTIVTKTINHTELTLRIGKALDGAITLDVLYAAMPYMQESAVRRLISTMCAEGVLLPESLLGTHCKVYLDADGRRRWLRRDPDGSLCMRVVPGRTFIHDRTAALLVAGFGHEFGMEFDRELSAPKCERKPDGFAWISERHALVVEVERMRGRNVHVWQDERINGLIKPGLLSSMIEIMRAQQRPQTDKPSRESLICLPARFVAKLEEQLAPRVQQLGPNQCGWWSVTMEDPWADPIWHAMRGSKRRDLPGLRTIRERLRTPRPSDPPRSRGSLRRDLRTILEKARASTPQSQKPAPSPSRASLRQELRDILERAKKDQNGNKP